jgi:hypothetical protein
MSEQSRNVRFSKEYFARQRFRIAPEQSCHSPHHSAPSHRGLVPSRPQFNTHFRKTFVDVLGKAAAGVLLRRVTFHYTPKHASWLNMAEIEIGIMDRQCTGQRIATVELLQTEVESWQQQRNTAKRDIEWRFTRQDADRKLSKYYVP